MNVRVWRIVLPGLLMLWPVLSVAAADAMMIDPSLRWLANPNFAFAVLLLGLFGLLFEAASPGLALPGLLGAVMLLLALFALQMLGANMLALVPILLGLLALASPLLKVNMRLLPWLGVLLFTLGSLGMMWPLRETSALPVLAGLALAVAVFFYWLVQRLRGARERPGLTGRNSLLGHEGTVVDGFAKEGRVSIGGVYWTARSDAPQAAGARVKVIRIDGLTVTVQAIQE